MKEVEEAISKTPSHIEMIRDHLFVVVMWPFLEESNQMI